MKRILFAPSLGDAPTHNTIKIFQIKNIYDDRNLRELEIECHNNL